MNNTQNCISKSPPLQRWRGAGGEVAVRISKDVHKPILLFLTSIFLLFSCSKPCRNAPPKKNLTPVTIPFKVATIWGKTDTIFHLGTYGLYDYWDSLDKMQEKPTGYFGFIFFNDTANFKQSLRFNPYISQNIFEIPIHLEQGMIPQLRKADKRLIEPKVTDSKITFKSTYPQLWASLELYIIARPHVRE